MKRPDRMPTRLSESLHRQINAYALAASAAGVGMLALAQPAEARIVYTRAFLHIDRDHPVALDLSRSGRTDFLLWEASGGSEYSWYWRVGMAPYRGKRNAVALIEDHPSWAAPLQHGDEVGPDRQWEGNPWDLVVVGGVSSGEFRPPHQHYIGLRFVINGETHYGWARFSGIRYHNSDKGLRVWGDVTGYAYETIPNKPIIAGKTHGKDESTLGRLAQGAAGVRKKQ